MSNRAWVTLATNDSYGLGALVLAHSLRRAGSAYPSVVLITPSVTEPMRDRLRAVFAEVVIVDVLDSRDATHLALLQRPELGITFTKIHCWGLTQYEKCVFLDADILIVQNCDELFEREELSAAPDVGWPDCFNSGVFVYKPSAETFDKLIQFAQERGSFDGGDQGLLNSFFSDWAHGDINKHLPFLYNVTSAAFYSYLPALKHYGQNLKIIHFIGAAKPWLQQYNFQSRSVDAPEHLREFLQQWWDLFVSDVHCKLDESMVEAKEGETYQRPPALLPQDVYQHYEPTVDPESEFPWHHPNAHLEEQIYVPRIDMTEFHDPWDMYRGHIPPNKDDSSSNYNELQRVEDQEEIRKYAWEYKPGHDAQPGSESFHQSCDTYQGEEMSYNQGRYEQGGQHWDATNQPNYKHQTEHWLQEHYHHQDHSHTQHFHEHKHDSFDHGETQYSHDFHHGHSGHVHHEHVNVSHDHSSQHHHHHVHNSSHNQHDEHNYSNFDHFHKNNEDSKLETEASHHESEQFQVQHVQIERTEKKTQRRRRLRRIDVMLSVNGTMNGDVSEDSESYEDIIPRHPYDGFYLRHRATIDALGRKVCSHEIPPTPSPSPPPSPRSESPIVNNIELLPEDSNHGVEDGEQSGVAGNLARVVAGVGAPREALDELTRRQGWEAGNIDYMGADSFDNIWAKISQTLNQTRISPPKQPSPPKEASPPKALVEVAQEATPAPIPATESAEPPVAAEAPIVPDAPVMAEVAAPAVGPVTTEAPTEVSVTAEEPLPIEIPATVEQPAVEAPPAAEIPATVETPAGTAVSVEAPAVVETKKTEEPVVPPTPPATPKSTPEALTPESDPVVAQESVPVTVDPPKSAPAAEAAKPEATPEKPKAPATTDSPPLANTPSKEEAPSLPAAKSEERRKPGKLQLRPPAGPDPLPTPDSELEDAADLAQSIIASELQPATPAPSQPALPTPPALQPDRLSVADPEVPTPPVGAVSLEQIGVKPKGKSSTAAQIESSVTEKEPDAPQSPTTPTDKPADAPKKKVVKKAKSKEGASGDAPVPPPRKKEKKPKEK